MQSPFTLHSGIIERIKREADIAANGGQGRIIAKMNGLQEPKVIEALYDASRAGVEIDLIVRGICCLRTGVPGLSENIRVRSILGRFLEHHRVFYFGNNGDPELYLASADWMKRNLLPDMRSEAVQTHLHGRTGNLSERESGRFRPRYRWLLSRTITCRGRRTIFRTGMADAEVFFLITGLNQVPDFHRTC